MALQLKTILIRSDNKMSDELNQRLITEWLTAFDKGSPTDEFFAFVLDLKNREQNIVFSPKAISKYGISNNDKRIKLGSIDAVPFYFSGK